MIIKAISRIKVRRDMLRHVIIVNDFGHVNGGAGKVALTTAAALGRRGYDVTLFCGVAPVNEEMLKGVKVVCLGQQDILNDPKRLRAVRQGLWNGQAYRAFSELLGRYPVEETIVHFHSWTKSLSSSLFRATAEHGSKVVITLHDFFTICPNGGLFNYQQLKICRIRPSSAKCLCCNCDVRSYPQKIWRSMRHLIQSYWLKKNRDITVCAISQLNERMHRPNIKFAKQWFFLQNPIELNSKPLIEVGNNDTYLFMARLSKEKGCELFCRALTELNLKGCVLGDGYLQEELKKKYPNIEFAGWTTGERKEKYLRRCKALVFPSLWYECAPLTIVEMKSYGLPCIVPDECAAAEQVEDGKTGLIFKTGDLESLKAAIMRYEKSDAAMYQKNIVAKFNPDDYSEETYMKNLIGVYNKVIKD